MSDNGKQAIRYEKQNRVGIITLNNPPVNLLNVPILHALKKFFTEIPEDPDVRCIILRAEGKGFAAGADTSTFINAEKDDSVCVFGQNVMDTIEKCPVPTIAEIDGYCFGGGVELILCCDIRLASNRARFKTPEIHLGFPPTWGGSSRLPLHVGEAWGKMMLFTGDEFSAEKAEKMGLVQEIYPHEELDEQTLKLAAKIAGNAPIAMAILKEHILMARGASFDHVMMDERRMAVYNKFKEDAREGMVAFYEKREPDYKNR